MTKPRKSYTAAERARIVLDAIKGQMTQNEITSKYGVHGTQISSWKKQVLDAMPDLLSDRRRQASHDQTALIDELYKQIGQLKVELDWLKKKSELFH